MKDLELQLKKHRETKQEILYKQSPQIPQIKIKNSYNWKQEAAKLKVLSLEGKTLQELGDIYGVSKERIRQILNKYYPDLSRKSRGVSVKATEKRKKYLESLYHRTGRDTYHCSDIQREMARRFSRKKQNAKRSKWDWLITPTDIEFPLICPILGIELDWFSEYTQENSPSFDRVDPTKGYIPGNVIICSWRANRIKNDGSAEEHRKIAEFLDNKLK